MRAFIGSALAALSIACLAAAFAGGVLAQNTKETAPLQEAKPQLRQMPLTEKQIQGVLAVQKDMDAATSKLPENAKPDAKVLAQLDAVAKKSGFASYDEYSTVLDNISMVLGGFDPVTKKYVGSEAAIKSQIAQVEADKTMSAADKKQALADLNIALKAPGLTVEHKGNIDLVEKYYDKLAELMGEDEN